MKFSKYFNLNKETNITPITEIEKPFVVYELLGGSPADLLLTSIYRSAVIKTWSQSKIPLFVPWDFYFYRIKRRNRI